MSPAPKLQHPHPCAPPPRCLPRCPWLLPAAQGRAPALLPPCHAATAYLIILGDCFQPLLAGHFGKVRPCSCATSGRRKRHAGCACALAGASQRLLAQLAMLGCCMPSAQGLAALQLRPCCRLRAPAAELKPRPLGRCFPQVWWTGRTTVILALSSITMLPLCFPRTLDAISGAPAFGARLLCWRGRGHYPG